MKQSTTPSPATPVQKEGFTAGQWEVNSKHGNRIWIASKVGTDNTMSEIIAEVLCNPSCSEDKEAEANAALIAEAKNLFHSLKNFVDGIDIICEGLEDGQRKDTYLSIQKSLTYTTAKTIINRIQSQG